MAGPVTTAASLLLLALCTHCILPTDSTVVSPSPCCITFVSKKIPEENLVSYQLISRSVCLKEGVIFTTKKDLKFCGDPMQSWVQSDMKKLDAKQKQLSLGV